MQRFDEMRQEVPQLEVITCTALLSACGKGGKPEMALQFIDEMRQEGLQSHVITYSALISACSKVG